MKKTQLLLFTLLLSLLSSHIKAQVVIDSIANDSNINISESRKKNAFAIDPSDHVWVGYSIGATKWDHNTWTFYNTGNSGIPSDVVLSFAFTPGIAWIGTDKGLAEFANSVWTIYDSLNSGLQSNYIRSLFADGSNLWIGTDAGTYYFDGNNFTEYSTSNSGIVDDTIQCIGKTSAAMWFGTKEGLSKFASGTFTNFDSTNSALHNNNIRKLLTDGHDNLWIQTEIGMFETENQLFHSDGNLIYSTMDKLTGCRGIPHSVWLVGIDHTGRVILANSYNNNERQEIILLDMNAGEDLIITPGQDSFFESVFGPNSKKFAVSSNDNIWMVININGVINKIFSLDYASAAS